MVKLCHQTLRILLATDKLLRQIGRLMNRRRLVLRVHLVVADVPALTLIVSDSTLACLCVDALQREHFVRILVGVLRHQLHLCAIAEPTWD